METINKTKEQIQVWDGITASYRSVYESGNFYSTVKGERLYRVETKGISGKTLYSNGYYIEEHKEMKVYGMGGSTGHGWGGSIVGYATEKEIKEYPVKIK